MIDFLAVFAFNSYVLLFALLVLSGLGLPVPEDLTLGLAGFLYNQGYVKLLPALLLVYVGILIGDLIVYFLGKHIGRGIVRHRWLARLTSRSKLDALEPRFLRWGSYILLVARHIPGIRVQLLFFSGMMRMSISKFIAADGAAALLSMLVWGGIGYMSTHFVHRAIAHPMFSSLFSTLFG